MSDDLEQLISPRRFHRLLPSDIEFIEKSIKDENCGWSIAVSYFLYLNGFNNPTAVDIDDVYKSVSQLSVARLWTVVDASTYFLIFSQSLDSSIAEALEDGLGGSLASNVVQSQRWYPKISKALDGLKARILGNGRPSFALTIAVISEFLDAVGEGNDAGLGKRLERFSIWAFSPDRAIRDRFSQAIKDMRGLEAFESIKNLKLSWIPKLENIDVPGLNHYMFKGIPRDLDTRSVLTFSSMSGVVSSISKIKSYKIVGIRGDSSVRESCLIIDRGAQYSKNIQDGQHIDIQVVQMGIPEEFI